MSLVADLTSPVLIVDDDESSLERVRDALRADGFKNVLVCQDGREVLEVLSRSAVSLVLLDLVMAHVSGERVLEEIRRTYPDLPVIVATGEYEVGVAVRCMKHGAMDYLLKPLSDERLVGIVRRALEASALRYECTRLREQFCSDELHSATAFERIITADPAMLRVFAYLEAVSRGSHAVLISGETGTGKELIARALHDVGRAGRPFVAVNVAGLDDTMFSDTLFGHEAGAFTGARDARAGMIETAADGTLFLDEIGDLSEASQVKLLRLLQEREYFRLGSDQVLPLAARVVAATHRDPAEFRQDLYYRLRSYHVRIPPLRERLGDLPLLIDHFLSAAAADLGRPKPAVPPELFAHLATYRFPGNIRELQAMVFDAVARHERGVMPVRAFLDAIVDGAPSSTDLSETTQFPHPLPSLRAIELAAVREALDRAQGNQSAAARMLGVSRPTIARHIAKLKDREKRG